jgi:hypothetical protein
VTNWAGTTPARTSSATAKTCSSRRRFIERTP